MKPRARLPFWVILILVIALGMGALWLGRNVILSEMCAYLVYETPIEPADAIVVLSGDQGARVEKAADLYRMRMGKRLLISGGMVYRNTSMVTLMRRQAMELGVPRSRIITETNSESTWENAKSTICIAQEQRFKKVIIVTSKYHTRRTFETFARLSRGSGIEWMIVGAPDSVAENGWWKDHEMTQFVMEEWGKTVFYWFRNDEPNTPTQEASK